MSGEEQGEGVLLYYKFVSIADPHSLGAWFCSLCSSLGLVGRIRIAPQGVNVTVGGTMASLHKHIDAVKSHQWLGECDFKLAGAPSITISESAISSDVGFDSLSVRIVKELVTLGVHSSSCLSISDAGIHLSAKEFHSKIQEAEGIQKSRLEEQVCAGSNGGDGSLPHHGNEAAGCVKTEVEELEGDARLVILDARNIYETRIGRFSPPKGVTFLDPQIRQYSDLPHWIDANAEKLQNKTILMYCTGGVRCEMASAYIKNKGRGFRDVFQLSGGIQRYLEAFPDGGYFQGKNFVFDHRVAVASSRNEVLGMCMICGVAFDDYSSRIRCSHCRMLVLICNTCQASRLGAGPNDHYLCELCKSNRMLDQQKSQCMSTITSGMENGAHSLQSVVNKEGELLASPKNMSVSYGPAAQRRLRILCLHGFRQSASSLKGRLASFTKKLKGMADFVFVDAPHEVPLIFQKPNVEGQDAHSEYQNGAAHKKFAWLTTPEMSSTSPSVKSFGVVCKLDHSSSISMPGIKFDRDQYKKQTEGWPLSWSKIETAFSDLGPFNGVLGFSQGAAIAGALCLLSESGIHSNVRFQFVILCSGFVSPAPEHQSLKDRVSLPLKCPSLHIFGDQDQGAHDRQITNGESVQLASMFTPSNSVILKHPWGHIVPCHKQYVNQVKVFLSQFL